MWFFIYLVRYFFTRQPFFFSKAKLLRELSFDACSLHLNSFSALWFGLWLLFRIRFWFRFRLRYNPMKLYFVTRWPIKYIEKVWIIEYWILNRWILDYCVIGFDNLCIAQMWIRWSNVFVLIKSKLFLWRLFIEQ